MNILLGFLSIIITFSLVVIIERLFKKEGLFVWISVITVIANILVCKSIEILGILIIGCGIWICQHHRKAEKKDILPIVFFLIAAVSFTKVSSVITTAFVLIGIYLLGKDSPNKTGYFMLAWIFSNIIFFSYYNIKVNRYFLPIFPAIIYFLMLSIESIENRIKIKNLIPAILIVLFIVQAFAFPFTFDETYDYKATEDVSNYIIENNPDYENMSIGTYNMRPYNWWLGNNVIGIESDNQTAVDESNVTYYISNHQLDNLTNYTEINRFGKLHLYEKTGV